jgi:hypothetical protein
MAGRVFDVGDDVKREHFAEAGGLRVGQVVLVETVLEAAVVAVPELAVDGRGCAQALYLLADDVPVHVEVEQARGQPGACRLFEEDARAEVVIRGEDVGGDLRRLEDAAHARVINVGHLVVVERALKDAVEERARGLVGDAVIDERAAADARPRIDGDAVLVRAFEHACVHVYGRGCADGRG